jgi:hypothetical protein
MTGLFNLFTGIVHTSKTLTSLLALGLAAGAFAMAPSAARAGDDDRRYGDRDGRDYRHTQERRYDRDHHDSKHHDRKHHGHHDKGDVKVEINLGGRPAPRYSERRVRYWVEPEFKCVTERVWVEPVYKTVTERVWIEPVYKTVYEEVRQPARYEVREVTRYIGSVRVTSRDRVLIEPACTRRVAREVCVSEGRWEVIEKRICVSEGRWNVIEKQVCVREGRWDHRVERVEYGREAEASIGIRF